MVHLVHALLFHTPRYISHCLVYSRFVLSTDCLTVDSHNSASCQFILLQMVHHVAISTSCGNQSTFIIKESPINLDQYNVRAPLMRFYSFLVTHCSQPTDLGNNIGGVSLGPLAKNKKEKSKLLHYLCPGCHLLCDAGR